MKKEPKRISNCNISDDSRHTVIGGGISRSEGAYWHESDMGRVCVYLL